MNSRFQKMHDTEIHRDFCHDEEYVAYNFVINSLFRQLQHATYFVRLKWQKSHVS